MDEGFLSANVRDAITVIGLILAVIQIIISFLTPVPATHSVSKGFLATIHNAVRSLNDNKKPVSIYWELRIAIALFVLILIMSFLVSSAPFWVRDLNSILCALLVVFQYVAIGGVLGEIDEWLKQNADSLVYLKLWRTILFSVCFTAMLLSLYAWTNYDYGRVGVVFKDNWIKEALSFQVFGLLLASMLIIFVLTFVSIAFFIERLRGR